MNGSIKVLLVEDNPGDVRLLREAVAEIAAPRLEWVTAGRLDTALQCLAERRCDIILLDLSLPDSHGLDTFLRLSEHATDMPIVVLTGLDDQEMAVRTVQAGAQDYLVKGSFDGHLLVRALRYAMERLRTLRAEQAARAEAEAAQRRLALLVAASDVLVSGLEHESSLAKVAHLLVPHLADLCAIDVVEEGELIRRVAVAPAGLAGGEAGRPWRECCAYLDDPCGIPEVVRSGLSRLIAEVDDLLAVAAVPEAEHLRSLERLQPRSALIVPLRARGRSLGAITLLSSTPARRYDTADRMLAEDLARRVATALDNAHLYRTQKEIAATLQRSLLPPELPRIPGIELSASYHPMGEGIEAGGDFYDVFETVDRRWALVMGDVAGKGPAAAAVTALVRHTVRSVAMQNPAPAQVLARANEAILPQLSEDTFCTLAYACLQPTTTGARVTVASGGHPPPFLLREPLDPRAQASAEVVGRPGMILGVAPGLRFSEEVLELSPGDTLVFYTDGVTEARGGGEFFTEERLEALVERCAGLDAGRIAERIEATVMEFQEGHARDDVAILVLRVLDKITCLSHDAMPVPAARERGWSPALTAL